MFQKIMVPALVITLSFPSVSKAYSIPNHKVITRSAFTLLEQCEISKKGEFKKIIKTITKINAKQDYPHKKPLMWHFPNSITEHNNPNKKDIHCPFNGWVIDPTFNHWFEYLEKQAAQESSLSRRAPAIGALVHFIQDMAVPAHVAPIFHPSKFVNGDKFDGWDRFNPDDTEFSEIDIEDDERVTLQQVQFSDKKICDLLVKKQDPIPDEYSPANLLNTLHKNTLKSINENINDICLYKNRHECSKLDKKPTWKLFWPENVKDNGFSNYNCGEGGAFGEEIIRCEVKSKEGKKIQKYGVAFSEYKEFAMARLKDAVIATAKLILYYKNLPVGNRDNPDSCGDRQWIVNKKILKCLNEK